MESKQPLGKHRMSSTEPCPDMPPAKNLHLDEESSEEEVADMVVDDGLLRRSSGPSDRAKKFREELEKNRKERREKGARRLEKLATREDIFFDFTMQEPLQPQPTDNQTPDTAGKRKGVSSETSTIPAKHYSSYIPLR